MYSPLTYWQNRLVPAPHPLPGYAKEYVTRHIKDADTILDFGIGEGRMLPLYEGKQVTGCDIVFRDLPVPMIYYPKGTYDVVIASKVLLHIKPDEIQWYIYQLGKCSDKVIVYDTIAECTAPHNFTHDFGSMVQMNDTQTHGNDLLFWYS